MILTEKLSKAREAMGKTWWIVFVPIVLDVIAFTSYTQIFKMQYYPPAKFFILKLGVISAPPSASYLLENFPSIIIGFNSQYGVTGFIREINLLNMLIVLSSIMIMSFFKSGYMGCIERAGIEKVKPLDFFVFGNKNWFKFFVLDIINIIPALLMFKSLGYIYLMMLFVIFFYVKYSIVVDDKSLGQNFSRGISLLFDNFGLTIKMALYYGFLFSLVSPVIFYFSASGNIGVIISIVIISFLGVIFNKATLEIYRGIVNGEAIIKNADDNTDNVGE